MNIRKYTHVIMALAVALTAALVSCSESDDTVEEFPDWKNTNVTYFQNLYDAATAGTLSGTWKVITNYSFEDSIATGDATKHIVVEVLEEGTGSGCPLFTDSVLVSYRGRMLPSTSYPEGYVFDETYTGDYDATTAVPTQFYVADLVDGFTTALQYMHIGDVWRVYMPYELAYGSSGSGYIPAYSTLIFDIALTAYFRAGVTPMTWSAPQQPTGWITE